jgi:hypothetical protein
MDIPEHSLFGKVVPVLQKDQKKNFENYRPIAKLCLTSKIFGRIINLEERCKIDLTRKSQPGFKQKHITKTPGLLI